VGTWSFKARTIAAGRTMIPGVAAIHILDGHTSEELVESHEAVVTDRRGYNHTKMLAIHRNALMRVENLPKSAVDFSDVDPIPPHDRTGVRKFSSNYYA
jgi:hypothetical protein